METLIALKGINKNYIGYANTGVLDSFKQPILDSPIIYVDSKCLVAVKGSKKLYQYLLSNTPSFEDTSYKAIYTGLSYLETLFKEAELLIITIDGTIFFWGNGDLYTIDNDFVVIGDNLDLSNGCMSGLSHSHLNQKDKLSTALDIIKENTYGNLVSVGIESI